MTANAQQLPGDDMSFASNDLGATEDFLVRAYTKMTIGGDGESTATCIERRWVGGISFDELEFGFTMSYDADPLRRVCLCRVHSGHIDENFIGESSDVFAPGDVTLYSPPELPYSGSVCAASYDLTMFDPAELDRVAGPAPGGRGKRVRLLGHRPVSPAAHRRLDATIDYVRHLVGPDAPAVTPLVASTVTAHLATVVLETFPSTAVLEPTPVERTAVPALVRRAMLHIDENAHTDISMTDIARAVHATPRALQYAFRRHLEMSPMEYLRRVRMDHVHCELVEADATTTTVQRVAAKWGFAHTGRFSALYRTTYGCGPSVTLRGENKT